MSLSKFHLLKFHGLDYLIFLYEYTPTVLDGKPVIGPVPGLSNVFLASGHEGGGLSLVILSLCYGKLLILLNHFSNVS